ncbi:MAG: XRE family transcriptional regulator [Syntrophomonas sp.]
MNNELGKFLKRIRAEKDLSLRELSARTGLSHSYLNNLENGADPRTGKPVSPTLPTLDKLAKGLDVPIDNIICIASSNLTTYKRRLLKVLNTQEQEDSVLLLKHPEQAYDFKMENIRLVPVLGQITAGEPCFAENNIAENNIEDWMPLDVSISKTYEQDLSQYYYLRIHGNSMEPILNDGDLVLVKQGSVDEGEIAVVLCGGENACVKKIQYLKEQDLLMLISRNPDYPPMTRPMAECQVLGKVILRIGEPRW